jgi:hypothetical protein
MTNRFTKRDNGYVHDALLNVEWHPVSIAVNNWQDAQDQAAALGDGWRCPTVDELCTLPDRTKCNPAIDTTYFPDTRSDWYWSSSPVVGWPEHAWGVNFYGGYVYGLHRGSGFVRPVRVRRAMTDPKLRELLDDLGRAAAVDLATYQGARTRVETHVASAIAAAREGALTEAAEIATCVSVEAQEMHNTQAEYAADECAQRITALKETKP